MPEAHQSDGHRDERIEAEPDYRPVEPHVYRTSFQVGLGVSAYALVATAVVILLLSAGLWIQTFRIGGLKKDVELEKGKVASFIADAVVKAAAEQDKYREIERHLTDTRDAIGRAHTLALAGSGVVARDLVRDVDRMRFVAAESPRRSDRAAPVASCAAERGRAEAAGVLLEGYVRSDVQLTDLLERRERDVEALQTYIERVREAVNERARRQPALATAFSSLDY